MHKPITKRQKILRALTIFLFVPLIIGITVTILTLQLLGYKFQLGTNTVNLEQGGLLQLDSKPHDATIYVDDEIVQRPAIATSSVIRHDIANGNHTVKFERDSYESYTRDFTIKPEQVLWLNYIRMIPSDKTIEEVFSSEQISDSIVSSGGNRIAILSDNKKPNLTVIDITTDTPKIQNVTLSEDIFTLSGKNETYKLLEWAPKGDKYILLEKTTGNKKQWAVVNTQDIKETKLAGQIPTNAKSISFYNDDQSKLFGLSAGKIITTKWNNTDSDLESFGVNIKEVTYSGNKTLTYSKQTDEKNDVIYQIKFNNLKQISENASIQGVSSIHSSDVQNYELKEYENQWYAAYIPKNNTTNSTTIGYAKISGVDSENQDDHFIFSQDVDNFNYDNIKKIGFSPSGRFIYVQKNNSILTYDLELNTSAKIDLVKEDVNYGWLDDFHFWITSSDGLRIVDYDGQNSYQIANSMINQKVTLSNNQDYLYFFVRSENSVNLVRLKMKLD